MKTTLAERASPDTQLHYLVVRFIVEFFIEENMISTSGNIVMCGRHFGGQIALALVHPAWPGMLLVHHLNCELGVF